MKSDQFTQQVLDALQLDACQQAQILLDDYAQKVLPSLHSELTQQHLAHCADCRALYATIVTMNARLPALQSLRVPAGFTTSVMNRTVGPEITQPRVQKSRRLRTWLMRPRFALESAYAMTAMVMLFSGLTGVNAFDADLWERARPRLPESTLAFDQVSAQITNQITNQISSQLADRVEQQSERIESTYDNTTHAVQTWTEEKYTAITERLAELMR